MFCRAREVLSHPTLQLPILRRLLVLVCHNQDILPTHIHHPIHNLMPHPTHPILHPIPLNHHRCLIQTTTQILDILRKRLDILHRRIPKVAVAILPSPVKVTHPLGLDTRRQIHPHPILIPIPKPRALHQQQLPTKTHIPQPRPIPIHLRRQLAACTLECLELEALPWAWRSASPRWRPTSRELIVRSSPRYNISRQILTASVSSCYESHKRLWVYMWFILLFASQFVWLNIPCWYKSLTYREHQQSPQPRTLIRLLMPKFSGKLWRVLEQMKMP